MHELAIAENLMGIIKEESDRHRLKKVLVVRLKVGALAAVVPEALSFCFEIVSRESIAEGALLDIETIPVVARCSRCDLQFEVCDNVFLCPQCGEALLDLTTGRDLSIVSIEGETGEDDGSDQRSSGSEYSAGQ